MFLWSLDIVQEPTTENKNVLCYYAEELNCAYTTDYSRKKKGKKIINNLAASPCFYWDQFFNKKYALERHVKVCSSAAGIAYRFNN